MNIVIVDTSTSIGFDEVKWFLIEKINNILCDTNGHVFFINTCIDYHMFCSRVTEDDFDMKGSSSLWDLIYKIVEKYMYEYNIILHILTDELDTSSDYYTRKDVDDILWYRKLFFFWKVHWLKI